MEKLSVWKVVFRREDDVAARLFARTYVIAFLAGAVGIACPPGKPNQTTAVAHPGSPHRNAS